MNITKLTAITPLAKRRDERGAALITMLLLSTLLLAAGGALIVTTTMSATTAIDATAEMQAYYAAEAGIQAALGVVRGNAAASDGTTEATLRNIVDNETLWAAFNGSQFVPGTSNTLSYIATVDDISIPATDTTDPDDQPERLRIRVTGRNTRGAMKQMEMVVDRTPFDFDVNATVTLPNGSSDPIDFDLGDSNVTSYSGVDNAGNPLPAVPAFAVSGSDYTDTNDVIDDGNPNVYPAPADPAVLTSSNTPSFLQSVSAARTFLDGERGAKNNAISQGRYFTNAIAAYVAGIGADSSFPLTFVDGDMVIGPGNPSGTGTLIVTGTLTVHGNFNFRGTILVLGEGKVQRSGGGGGNMFGAIFVAKFDDDDTVFQAPTFDVSGGGNANIQYDSSYIDRARDSFGHVVLGVREY